MSSPGEMAQLPEADAIEELRKKIADVLPSQYDDLRLAKFLRARKNNVDAAAEMLRRHLRYAQRAGLSHILNDYTPHKKSLHFATAPLGYDRDGCLVRLLNVGISDLRGLALSHTHIEAARYAAYILEKDKLEQKLRFQETGKGGEDAQVYILDLKGLQWSLLFCRPLAQIFVFLLRLYEANYPESLKRAYVVNAPSFFSLIYTFVKTILPSEILSKVDVLSADQTISVLREAVDPSILPQSLGGTRTDPDGDPNCNNLYPVPLGSVVPEEYYLETDLGKDPSALKTTVMNQSSFKLELEVDAPHTVLLWDFQTIDYDIGMCLNFRKKGEENTKTLLPLRRINCHRYIESGRYECEEPGIYELLFDNTYSWWQRKELIYKTAVVKPGEEIIETTVTTPP